MCRKWDERFLSMADLIAGWSKDPSTKVGAVIVNERRQVVGMGYNGFARGVDDREERYLDRAIKYPLVIHAETNAVLSATSSLTGCTIYSPYTPCARCASLIIQSGIKRVVRRPAPIEFAIRWAEEIALAEQIFAEAGVICNTIYPVENEDERAPF